MTHLHGSQSSSLSRFYIPAALTVKWPVDQGRKPESSLGFQHSVRELYQSPINVVIIYCFRKYCWEGFVYTPQCCGCEMSVGSTRTAENGLIIKSLARTCSSKWCILTGLQEVLCKCRNEDGKE